MSATLDTFPALFAAGFDGQLPEPDVEPGPCELCGHHGQRVAWRPPPGWTAFEDHAFPGERANCVGCALLLTGGPDPDRPRVRWMYHSLAADGQRSWVALKDRRDLIRRWVLDDRVSVSVIDNGKRHRHFQGTVTRPGRVTVTIDGRMVDEPLHVFEDLLETVEHAVRAGVAKRALLGGVLDHEAIRRLGVQAAREVQALLDVFGARPVLELACFLATKENE